MHGEFFFEAGFSHSRRVVRDGIIRKPAAEKPRKGLRGGTHGACGVPGWVGVGLALEWGNRLQNRASRTVRHRRVPETKS